MWIILAIFLVICTAFVGIISEKWRKVRESKRTMRWLPHVPGLPFIGNALQFGDSSGILVNSAKMIDDHGKLILLNVAGQLNLLATDYDFVEFVLGTQEVMNKSNDYEFIRPWLGTGLLISGGQKWKTRRKLITPAFHFSILENFIDAFESNGKILVGKLNAHIGEQVEIQKYITLYALDIITESAMGTNLNAQTDMDSEYVKGVRYICNTVVDRVFSSWKRFDFLYRFTMQHYRERKTIEYLHSVTNSVIDARRGALRGQKNNTEPSDEIGGKRKMAFLDILLQSKVNGESLSQEDIREEVDTFMFEGHDTTSSAMTFTIYMLGQHQDIQQTAADEQKAVFGDDLSRKSTYQDLQDMKYLDCIIREVLRLYPSVPFFGRTAHEDILYKGNIIPKGTNITLYPFKMLRDPDNFPDPEKFDPSRFEEDNLKKRPFSYVPFSAGSRNCIGQRFAMLEMKSTISKILRNFHVLPCPNYKLHLVLEVILKAKEGVMVKFEKRKW